MIRTFITALAFLCNSVFLTMTPASAAPAKQASQIPSQFIGSWSAMQENGANACAKGDDGANSRDDLFLVKPAEVLFIEGGCKPIRFAPDGRAIMDCGAEGEGWTADQIWSIKRIEGARHLIVTTLRTYSHVDANGKPEPAQPDPPRTDVYQECRSITGPLPEPKAFVTAESTLNYDSDKKYWVVDTIWKFDEQYSKFATADINKDGTPPSMTQLAPLAKTNVESLKEFNYFISAVFDGAQATPGEPTNYFLEVKGANVFLHFTLPFPAIAKFKTALISFYDGTNFVRFSTDMRLGGAIASAPNCRYADVQIDPNGHGRNALSAFCD